MSLLTRLLSKYPIHKLTPDDIPEGISPEAVREDIKNSLKEYLRQYFKHRINEIAEAESKGENITIPINPPEKDQTWINELLLYDYFLEEKKTLPELWIKAVTKRDEKILGDPVESKRSFKSLDSILNHYLEPMNDYVNEEIKQFYKQNLPDLDKIFQKRIDEILQEIRLEIESEIQTRRAEQQTIFEPLPKGIKAINSSSIRSTLISKSVIKPEYKLKIYENQGFGKALDEEIFEGKTGRDIVLAEQKNLDDLTPEESLIFLKLVLFSSAFFKVNQEHSKISEDKSKATFTAPLDKNFYSFFLNPVQRSKGGWLEFKEKDKLKINSLIQQVVSKNITYTELSEIYGEPALKIPIAEKGQKVIEAFFIITKDSKRYIEISIHKSIYSTNYLEYFNIQPKLILEIERTWKELTNDPEYKDDQKDNPYRKYGLTCFAFVIVDLLFRVSELYSRENDRISDSGFKINTSKILKTTLIERLKFEPHLIEHLRKRNWIKSDYIKSDNPHVRACQAYILTHGLEMLTGKELPLRSFDYKGDFVQLNFRLEYFDPKRTAEALIELKKSKEIT